MPVSHRTKLRSGSKSRGTGSKREVDVDAFTAAGRKIVDRKRRNERGVKAVAAQQMPTAPAATDLGFKRLPGPSGVADNLKKLPGVSPAIEKQLNGLGGLRFRHSHLHLSQRCHSSGPLRPATTN